MNASESTKTAGDFFIVDNSDEHWKALRYLKEWCQLSKSIDIATGYFEVGALLALDEEWQTVDKIRILIGSETSRSTVAAVREAQAVLDRALSRDVQEDPFLSGLTAVVDAIRSGQIEIRVYRKKKFHAKAYITHGRLDVVGSAALVGSSNFTPPGMTRNVELNVRFTGVEVRDLQDWYESYWSDAEDVSPELLQILDRHDRVYSPFEVYAKALSVLARDVEPGATEWEENHSLIYPMLAPYQREAYHGLKQRAAQWRGAFLTDGVGLGKTFVGLMLAEYFAVKERKKVLILATKTAQDAVWERELDKRLPGLSGVFSTVHVMAHTDLSKKDALEEVQLMAERVDIVIIDEAHNFRNRGARGEEEEGPKSRWWRLQEICKGKTVFLLTATPINNNLFDFVHQCELFTGMDDSYFSSLGVPSIRTYVGRLEADFELAVGDAKSHHAAVPAPNLADFEKMMFDDKLLEALIVQNSRQYAQKSALAVGASAVLFPVPSPPRAVPYNYTLAFGALLTELEWAFKSENPLFILPMYYPLAYSKNPDIDTKLENRQRQIVGLIRTTFLKRFESSIAAFAGSCADLASKIAQWIADNSGSIPGNQARVVQWREANDALLTLVHDLFRPGVDVSELEFSDDEEGGLFGEVGADGEFLKAEDFDLQAMFNDAFDDLARLTSFLEHAVGVGQVNDDKFLQLVTLLLGGKEKASDVFDSAFATQKVLVFTEYADTARYITSRLEDAGLDDLDRLDGSRKGSRLSMIQRFAPHYNGLSSDQRAALDPLRVLVTTDVLAEGVNLQDATLVVNYDIHWNPVRLMQRIGRVDRRLDQTIEEAIVKENPKTKSSRGRISVRNFLPPDELNRILSLYSRVQNRVLLISKTLGIPGGRLLTEDDMLDDVKVFNSFLEEYQGAISPSEALRLRYLDLTNQNPGLEQLVAEMPNGVHASKSGAEKGLFQCSIEPIRTAVADDAEAAWTLDEGRVRWAFRGSDGEELLNLGDIDQRISCDSIEPGLEVADRIGVRDSLRTWKAGRLATLQKDTGLPLNAPKPESVCWVEVQ